MFCPQCAAEYRSGFTRCSDCDIELVEQPVLPESNHKIVSRDSSQKFFLLTLGLTWGVSASVYFVGIPSSGVLYWIARALLFLAAFAPSLFAIGLIAVEDGTPGVMKLFRQLLIWRVEARWYLFALFYMAAIVLAVIVGYRLFARSWLPLGPLSWFTLVSPMITSGISRVFVRASEEVGWRGYALPRLAERFGLRQANIILGPLWAAWHLPLFLNPLSANYHQSFPAFVLEVTALSVVFSWLYVNTRCSLLLATLMHSAIDETLSSTRALLPQSLPLASSFAFPMDLSLLFIGFLWISAGYLLKRMPRGSFHLMR
jgi:uncharacterized protein